MDERPSTLTAREVVEGDCEYIGRHLSEEFPALGGKHLLITGGAGFLGYYLVQSVLHWNRRVPVADRVRLTIYDNYIRGVPAWLRAISGDPSLTLINHDVSGPLPADIPDFAYIMHAASIASPTYYRAHPIETMDANVQGLRTLLEYFRRQKERNRSLGGLLFFSSSEIYGDPAPQYVPTPETYRGNVSCTGPRACYDEAKRFGETLCVNFARHYELPIKICRPFNNYGPGLKISDRRVIPDFARDILAGRDIVLFSDGSPTRTFCYVADAVVGYYKVLVRGLSGEAYNIGVEEPEISIGDLAERLAQLAGALFGRTPKVIRHASPDQNYLADSPNRRRPMIAKARVDLGYDPTIALDEGLRRSLIWYTQQPNAEDA